MAIKKVAYFYSKMEVQTDTEYPDGWYGWYIDYFKSPVHVLDDNENDIIAEEGTVYLVPPDTRMYFKYKKVKSFVHTCLLFEADRRFIDSLGIPYRTPIKIKNSGDFERLLYDLQERQVSQSKFSERAQDLYFELILLFIHDEIYDYEKNYVVRSGDDLQSLRNTVMNSLAFPWTVENMANNANMSVSTFQRKYKQLYGITPIADLYNMRFEKSKMLLDTGYSIPYVLNSCCFKSFQHFSRFFKEREGITPSEYRDRTK